MNNYEKIIKEKDKIILELKEKINNLENIIKEKDKIKLELKEKKQIIEEKTNLYYDFNINLKNPIHIDKKILSCLCLLDDGRIASGSLDNSITIFNKISYKPDLIMNEHTSFINSMIKLEENILVSCSDDKTIKLFKIKDNNYEVIQILNFHKSSVNKIIELKNKNLVSISNDKSIIFYKKYNSKYLKENEILTNNECSSITQTKENEICYSEHLNYSNYDIYFSDFNGNKLKLPISKIRISGCFGTFNMITKDLLIIGGFDTIYIIDVNLHNTSKIIEVPDSKWIRGFCMINENMFLTGDNGTIRQWKIENGNINLFSKKEKAHKDLIYSIITIGEGKIASSSKLSIKIW